MHVVIINGSPRAQKYSNTEKIIASFTKGLSEKGVSFEAYAISNRKSWEMIRDAYIKNEEILIALPLYVECVPGLLLEFLETLPKKDEHTRLSFLLQSGFAEGCQLRCGEDFCQSCRVIWVFAMAVVWSKEIISESVYWMKRNRSRSQNHIRQWGSCLQRETGFFVKKRRNLPARNIFHCLCVC